jgi:hypothetical protein
MKKKTIDRQPGDKGKEEGHPVFHPFFHSGMEYTDKEDRRI